MKLDSDPPNLPLPNLNSAPVVDIQPSPACSLGVPPATLPPPQPKFKNQNSEIASSPDPIENQNQNSNFKIPKSRRTGKIARLPKKLRDLINECLSDGLTYSQVLEHLHQSTDPPLPYEISERNISGWHTGGYQDWLRHQGRLELLGHKLDFAFDLARNSQPDKLQELCLQLASVRMCEFLSELAIADPQTDPNIYLRLLSAVPRISKETLNLQKYRDAASAKALATDTALPASEADHAEACRTALLNRMDDFMGLKSYRHRPTPPPPSPPDPSPPQSKIENPNSKIPSTEAHGSLQKPNSNSAELLAAPSQSKIENQNSKIPFAPSEILNLKSEIPDPPPQSEFENQNSKIPFAPSETPNLEPDLPISPPQSKIQNPNSKIPPELCLECAHPLPTLLPNGLRPAKICHYCNFPLPPPGTCHEPSTEQCPMCHANLPRSLPDRQRLYHYCHNCGTPLPASQPQNEKQNDPAPLPAIH